MIVLHGLWDTANLYLWAESSALISENWGRNRRINKPQPHPFSLEYKALEEAIDTLGEKPAASEKRRALNVVHLPSTRTAPLPSPELILEDKPGDKEDIDITLRQWVLPSLLAGPDSALDFLSCLPAIPPRGITYGSSLRFWGEAAKFTLELLTRQCFLPALKNNEPDNHLSLQAVWEVFLNQDDTRRLQSLANAMPSVCRAMPSGNRPLVPLSLVSSFINETVDAFVRENLISSPLLPKRRSQAPTLAERWLHALCSDNPQVEATPETLASFSKELNKWLSQANPILPDSPFRTCFRLDSPEDNGNRWTVTFHLQASDDQSLIVPAEKVWATRSGVATFLKRRFENPQERLLADLGKASRVFPAINESLETARPVGVTLDTEHAYDFLCQSAPLLEESGFGVLLPSWWQKPSTRLSAKLKLKSKTKSGKTASGLFGMNSLVEYDWRIALGEHTLTREEFEKLADLKVPLVKVRGQWMEFKPAQIKAIATFFRNNGNSGEMKLNEALRFGLGGDISEAGLPVTGMEATGWIKDLLNRVNGSVTITGVTPPANFKGTLRPYQVKGFSWLLFLKKLGLGACLADDMGLGKTIEFIALMLHERTGRKRKTLSGPALLICPMSVVGNWQKEIERFAPNLSVMVHHGAERLSGPEFTREADKHDIVISTYALVQRDEKLFSTVAWECVALDEAQNIKNPVAKQTQSIKRLKTGHKVALTGTPVENRLSELWSIMDFLNPGYLKSAADFHAGFAVPIEKYRNSDRAETLKNLVQPFILRRLKTDPSIISDLPDKLEMKVFCNLTQE